MTSSLTKTSKRPKLSKDLPLFMWAGGKRRLIKSYLPLLENAGRFTFYVEPFAGGAALFDHLQTSRLKNGDELLPSILGDINSELICLFRVVRDNPKELLSELEPYERRWATLDKAGRKNLFYHLRETYWSMPNGTSEEQLKATALLYFLMKTAFNGIWQTCQGSNGRFGTPAGLLNQKGAVVSKETVERWHTILKSATLHAGSYADIQVPMGAFVYCDPPYRDSFTHYSSGWNDDDLIKLISWCRKQANENGCLVWLANRLTEPDDGFFDKWASDAERTIIPVVYTAGRRKRTEDGHEAKSATEVLLVWDGRKVAKK